jgi:hypothetical protein
MSYYEFMLPNTALEPTAFTRFLLRQAAGCCCFSLGRGSAFYVRRHRA